MSLGNQFFNDQPDPILTFSPINTPQIPKQKLIMTKWDSSTNANTSSISCKETLAKEGICSQEKHDHKTVDLLSQTGKLLTTTLKTCKCSRTKCLKMYCECFADGKICGVDCGCTDCHNTHELQE